MPDNYSEQELDEQKEKIKADLLFAVTPEKSPQAYLLAGQPGAGKTKLADIFARMHSGNIVFISSDDYSTHRNSRAR